MQEYGRVSIEVVKSTTASPLKSSKKGRDIEALQGRHLRGDDRDKQRGLRLEDILMLETCRAEVRRGEASIQQSVYTCGSDIFELGAHLWKQHPDFWMANRDNWDALLPTSTFTVVVSSEIEKVGSELRFSKNGQ
ncbi:MAG: Ger(x)C family spore germination C-terminal domain-containing protein [Oscillospiraceae bacterium]